MPLSPPSAALSTAGGSSYGPPAFPIGKVTKPEHPGELNDPNHGLRKSVEECRDMLERADRDIRRSNQGKGPTKSGDVS